MKMQTYLAVGELVQAAAHIHGLTGPVMFTVSATPEQWCGNCGDCDMCDDDCEFCGEWEQCTCFDNDTDEDHEPEEEFFYAQSFC